MSKESLDVLLEFTGTHSHYGDRAPHINAMAQAVFDLRSQNAGLVDALKEIAQEDCSNACMAGDEACQACIAKSALEGHSLTKTETEEN